MKSPSIEWLHAKLEKQIRMARSYTEIKELEFIVKGCRLKSYDYIFKNRDSRIVLKRHWFDEFGNSLKILKKKQIQIIYNDLNLDRSQIICTDLYYGLSLDKIAKMSKLVHLVAGKDEDLQEDCFLLTFLGIDNHLRSYLYLYGEWQTVSPLIMGLKALKVLENNKDIKYFRGIENKENSAIPCISGQTWISYLPPSSGFLDIVRKNYEMLLPIFES
jgi:hypothetical protein